MLKQLTICILILLFISSCREDFEQNIATPQNFDPSLLEDYKGAEDMAISTVTGFVADENDKPLQNALVVLDGHTTSTDVYGHFFFTEISMNTRGTVVNISLSGYHKASKLFYPASQAIEHLDIVMSKIEEVSEFSGASNGTLQIASSIDLEYSKDSFLKENGDIYSGDVQFSSSLLAYDDPLFGKKVLGNLQGVDLENKLTGLIPHAFLYLNIEDEDGEALRLSSTGIVNLTVPTDNMPTDVSVWYYAADDGLYTVNNDILKDENSITIPLKHNTSILLASDMRTQNNNISLKAADGIEVLENTEISILSASNAPLHTTRSNSLGQATLPFPMHEEATLRIKDACGNVVYRETTTNIETDFILDQVEVKYLEGDIYDCDVKLANNTVVRVAQGNQTGYHYLPNSAFALKLQTCDQGVASITALEDANADLSNFAAIDLNTSESFGDLFTCEDPKVNQLKITLVESGEEYSYPITSTIGSTDSNTEFLNIASPNIEEFKISFKGNQTGDYSAADLHSIERIWDLANGLEIGGDATLFEVIRFGDNSRVTIGSFEGNLENSFSNEMINIKGEFNFYFQE